MNKMEIKRLNQRDVMEQFREKMKEVFTHDWYFSGWEKLIIVACFLWSAWSVLSWIVRLIA